MNRNTADVHRFPENPVSRSRIGAGLDVHHWKLIHV